MSTMYEVCAMDFETIEKKARTGAAVRRVLTYGMLIFWGLMVLFPFYWMVLTSVKSYSSYNAEYVPKLFTLSPTFQNYSDEVNT
mgnify:CR=1 FL=1